MNPSIGIIAPNYQRPKVLHLFCESIKRIRKELDNYIPVCVISDEEDKNLCGAYHINHITQKNLPVTDKFNRGVAWARDMNFDHILISGSDDIFSTDTIRRIMEATSEGYDLIGVNRLYFYAGDGLYRGNMVRFDAQRMLGVGKTIKMDILAKVNYRPWTKDKNWGMDALVTQAITPYVKKEIVLNDTIIVDVKTRVNINKGSMWMNKIKTRTDPKIFYDIISEEEKQILLSL